MAQTDGDMPHDELLQCQAKFRQALRLRDKVVFQALSAQPFAFLEDDRTDGVLSWRLRFGAHADIEVITTQDGYGSSAATGMGAAGTPSSVSELGGVKRSADVYRHP